MMASSKCMQLLENCRCLLYQCIRWNRKYRKFNTVTVLNKHGIESRLIAFSVFFGREVLRMNTEKRNKSWMHFMPRTMVMSDAQMLN
ncbi:Photosystem I assembly protein [Trichinella spiralis]|uniref:Photosystem I assembly protein n=1 Tax=Trichinella spiralis TaxID=6334 RepID=A0ABR3KPJ4_TRISP